MYLYMKRMEILHLNYTRIKVSVQTGQNSSGDSAGVLNSGPSFVANALGAAEVKLTTLICPLKRAATTPFAYSNVNP
jgi:hypothetical protein